MIDAIVDWLEELPKPLGILIPWGLIVGGLILMGVGLS